MLQFIVLSLQDCRLIDECLLAFLRGSDLAIEVNDYLSVNGMRTNCSDDFKCEREDQY